MDRTFYDLNELERSFIDYAYVQLHPFPKTAQLLGIDLSAVSKLSNDLKPIWKSITKIRAKGKIKNAGENFWEFCQWYTTTEKRCHYCYVTQDELDQLHVLGIDNKRTTRGKTLEIDRRIANESYGNLPNLTFSCYWCNNAKTDTFTEEEFKIIGQAIGAIWKIRLNK